MTIDMGNVSNDGRVYDFVLSGFTNLQSYHVLLFTILLIIYCTIIAGNVVILLAVQKEFRLQSPMYFFIGALSCMEICYTAVTIPKMLADLLDEEKKISFSGCILQAYFLHALGASECYILAVMAYDRYLAICKPLRYSSVMTTRLYKNCVFGSYFGGFICPIIEMVFISSLPFCGPNRIEDVFCDFPPLISLACADTTFYVLYEFIVSFFILLSFVFILLSYIRIYIILKMKSKVGRQKEFSTCGAHLIVFILFYGSISFMYIRISKSFSADYDRAVGLTYVVFTPLANPIIYGLRNHEIKSFIQKHFFLPVLQVTVFFEP